MDRVKEAREELVHADLKWVDDNLMLPVAGGTVKQGFMNNKIVSSYGLDHCFGAMEMIDEHNVQYHQNPNIVFADIKPLAGEGKEVSESDQPRRDVSGERILIFHSPKEYGQK